MPSALGERSSDGYRPPPDPREQRARHARDDALADRNAQYAIHAIEAINTACADPNAGLDELFALKEVPRHGKVAQVSNALQRLVLGWKIDHGEVYQKRLSDTRI